MWWPTGCKKCSGRTSLPEHSTLFLSGVIQLLQKSDDQSDDAQHHKDANHALNHHFQRLGIHLNKELLDQAYDKFLKLADCKTDINDSDLYIIAGVTQDKHAQKIRLKYLQVVCGKNAIPMATVKLMIDGEECTATSSGNGPVDAAFQAVRSLVHRKINLEEYLVQAITRGTDDVGKVHIQIENKGNIYYGFSANTDIVTASVEAYVNAISKIL